jgi:SAM-dependent methyltransferase
MPVVRALLELADVGPQDLVYDLGSGDGRIPITAAIEFGARGVGIEIDPALVTQAQAKAREAGVEDKVEFRLGDMYAANVRSATVVTLFLHPGPNLKLREKLRSDLPAGARVVSYVWDMGGWTPADVRRVNEHRIFLWRIPSRAGVPEQGLGRPRRGYFISARQPSTMPISDGPGSMRRSRKNMRCPSGATSYCVPQ